MEWKTKKGLEGGRVEESRKDGKGLRKTGRGVEGIEGKVEGEKVGEGEGE